MGVLRRSGAAAGALAMVIGAAACGTDMTGFAQRADAACAKSARVIDRLDLTGDTSTGTPTAALRTALDRYRTLELLISELTEGAVPAGTDGADLERRWLDPARRSLDDRQPDLLALSQAVHDGQNARVPELSLEAAKAGTDGVDGAYLADNDMPACAALFSQPTG